MTKLMEQALETARRLPPDMQDDLDRMVLSFVGGEPELVELTPGDVEAVRRSREEFARGDVASDEQVRAVWAKHGL